MNLVLSNFLFNIGYFFFKTEMHTYEPDSHLIILASFYCEPFTNSQEALWISQMVSYLFRHSHNTLSPQHLGNKVVMAELWQNIAILDSKHLPIWDILSFFYAFDMVSAISHFPVCPPLYHRWDRQVFIRVWSSSTVGGESWGMSQKTTQRESNTEFNLHLCCHFV